jgi:pyruvate,orthophosphate dikinase
MGRAVPQAWVSAPMPTFPRDAIQARAFGAEGIGLCRTEHMFFAEDRMPHMRAMILANNEKDRRAALKQTAAHAAQRFHRRFPAMDGLPVTIRTLDPPLHEFLPRREDLMVEIAVLEHQAEVAKAKD